MGIETNVSTEEQAKYQKHKEVTRAFSIVVLDINEDEEETSERKNRLTGPTPFDNRMEIAQLDPLKNSELGILKSSRSVGMIIKKLIFLSLPIVYIGSTPVKRLSKKQFVHKRSFCGSAGSG